MPPHHTAAAAVTAAAAAARRMPRRVATPALSGAVVKVRRRCVAPLLALHPNPASDGGARVSLW